MIFRIILTRFFVEEGDRMTSPNSLPGTCDIRLQPVLQRLAKRFAAKNVKVQSQEKQNVSVIIGNARKQVEIGVAVSYYFAECRGPRILF